MAKAKLCSNGLREYSAAQSELNEDAPRPAVSPELYSPEGLRQRWAPRSSRSRTSCHFPSTYDKNQSTNQENHHQPEASKVSFRLLRFIFVFNPACVPKLKQNLSLRVQTILRRHTLPAGTCQHRHLRGRPEAGGTPVDTSEPPSPLAQQFTQVPAREQGSRSVARETKGGSCQRNAALSRAGLAGWGGGGGHSRHPRLWALSWSLRASHLLRERNHSAGPLALCKMPPKNNPCTRGRAPERKYPLGLSQSCGRRWATYKDPGLPGSSGNDARKSGSTWLQTTLTRRKNRGMTPSGATKGE